MGQGAGAAALGGAAVAFVATGGVAAAAYGVLGTGQSRDERTAACP
jgi:hypothetical protein